MAMDLDELVHTYGLPEEVVEFCRANNLHDLSAIQRQISTARSFSDLPGCTPDVEHRLLLLITNVDFRSNILARGRRPNVVKRRTEVGRVKNSKPTYDPPEVDGPAILSLGLSFDPDLDELKKHFGLSVRAYNVCDNADLKYLSSIRARSRKPGGFHGLRNCGISTRMELDMLLEKTAMIHVTPASAPLQEQALSDETERLPIDPDLAQLRELFGMSVRAFNVCENHDLFRLSALVDYTVTTQDFGRLRNCGEKTRKELHELVERASSRFKQPEGVSRQELDLRKWAGRHAVDRADLAYLASGNGGMTLLRFLEHYFDKPARSAQKEVQITLLKCHKTWPKYLELGQRFGITEEHARQITRRFDKAVKVLFDLVVDLPNAQESYPELIPTGPVFIIDEELAAHLNNGEGTAWTPMFYSHLAAALNGYRYTHIRWTELFGKSDRTRSWDHTIPIMLAADLEAPLRSIGKRFATHYEQKRKKADQFDLLAGIDIGDEVLAERLTAVLQGLISRCYPEVRFESSVALLPPNKKQNQEDLLEEVLTLLDTPSHASRIQESWNALFPERPVTMEGIRGVAIRAHDRFFSIGRSSTYGLRRWEEERKELKGGTIRDIVAEVLEPRSLPIHIDELVIAVQEYRPSTHKSSVRQNLQLEASGRFTFHPGGFIGLSNRVYEHIPDPPARVSGSLMRTAVLARFKGLPLTALAKYLASKSEASTMRVAQVLDKAIAHGRIQIDSNGMIIEIASPSVGGEEDQPDVDLPAGP